MMVYMLMKVDDEEYGCSIVIGCYAHREDAEAELQRLCDEDEDHGRWFPWYRDDDEGLARWWIDEMPLQ